MKLTLVTLTIFFFSLITKFSHANERPLIGKYNHSGHTIQEFTESELCEVFNTHIIHSYQLGLNSPVVTTHPFKLTEGTLMELVEKANSEELSEQENNLCDAPSSYIKAYGLSGDPVLFSTGGCGSPRLERQGEATKTLRAIVDLHCPQTFDY